MRHPGIHLPVIHAERDRAIEGECRILADKVIAGAVTHLDRVVLDRVEDLKAGTISPAAKTRIWNLLSVASATRFARYSAAP